MVAISPSPARRSPDRAALAEWLLGACFVALIGWGSRQALWFYNRDVLPSTRTIPAVPLPRVVRLDDHEAVKRAQRTTDLLGEATTYLVAKRRGWARAAAERALALDPENPQAQELVRQLREEPEPTPTAEEQEARWREDRVMQLLGEANAFFDAGEPDVARPLVEEAAALAPTAPIVRAVGARLSASP